VEGAKEAGYQIHLVYVALRDAELHIERVRLRVLQGGHGVPDSDIRRRYDRSLKNACKVMRLAHFTRVYDNSTTQCMPVLRLEHGRVIWSAPFLPAWVRGIQSELESVP
jgi:predicted ABC-type ATPase